MKKTIISSLICCAAMSVFANPNADQLNQLSAAVSASTLPLTVEIVNVLDGQYNNLKISDVQNYGGATWDPAGAFKVGGEIDKMTLDTIVPGTANSQPLLSTITIKQATGAFPTAVCKLNIFNFRLSKITPMIDSYVTCNADAQFSFDHSYNSKTQQLTFTIKHKDS